MALDGKFVSSGLSVIAQRIGRRFATKSSRFSLAISSGFVIATVGFLVVCADTKFGVAQNWFGLGFANLGGNTSSDVAPIYREPSPQYVAAPRRHHIHLARHKLDEDGNAEPVALSRQSYCVRLCDGFAFPVGNYHGESDRSAHEATCQSECPGAQTALFVMPQGGNSISDATEVGSDRNYSEMPDAFHYTTYVDETCSCHPHSGNRIKSLLRDFTLRRGDAVMTARGMRVFHGGSSYPYKRKDFVALANSRDIRKGARANLSAIERASLVMPATVAAPQPMISDARRNTTKVLQHQAAN